MTLIQTAKLKAEIAPLGAELVRLRDGAGRDYLWDGDPTFWKGRAPLLFPIVGKVPDDTLQVNGVGYPMRQHGLARISIFELVAQDETSCLYRLDSSNETRQAYPFEFRLDVRYALADATLTHRGAGHQPRLVGDAGVVRLPSGAAVAASGRRRQGRA